MRVVDGKFHGTGATVYICCGFVPDFVWLINLEDIAEMMIWARNMNLAAAVEGVAFHDITSVGDQAVGEGIRPYYGGETLTSTMAGTTTYGEGVYLKPNKTDYRFGANLAPGGGSGDGATLTIDTWTLNTPGSRSGQFNGNVTGTYIGAGSQIQIDGKWYVIETLTAAAGSAADSVVLNVAAKSGQVQCIKGMYGYSPMIAGQITPAGFGIRENTHLNANDQMIWFQAGCFDN